MGNYALTRFTAPNAAVAVSELGSDLSTTAALGLAIENLDKHAANLDTAGAWTALQSFGTNLGGTLQTAAQPNITSVGILASPHMTTAVVDSGGLQVTAGNVGFGAAPATHIGIAMPRVGNGGTQFLTSTSNQSYGLLIAPTHDQNASTLGAAIVGQVATTAAAYTMTSAYTLWAQQAFKGAGSAITTLYGLYVDPLSAGSTSNYGIYVNAPSGGSGVNEAVHIEGKLNANGTVVFPSVGTTASAANAFLDNAASNNLLRSTSSLRYKDVLGPLTLAEALHMVTGVEATRYRSKSPADGFTTEFIGLIAEQVASIDQRLVTKDVVGRPDWVQYPVLVAPLCQVVADIERRLTAAGL